MGIEIDDVVAVKSDLYTDATRALALRSPG
jgi:hypothetical protein